MGLTNKSINITVPTNNNELTNGAGYITGIDDTMIATALGYTPVDPADLSTVATSGSYTDLSDKPHIPDAATSVTTLTTTADTLVFTKADLSQESVDFISTVTASTITTLN